MKIRNFSIVTVIMLFLFSCITDDIVSNAGNNPGSDKTKSEDQTINEIGVNITPQKELNIGSMGRTAFDESNKQYTWQESDMIGIFPEEGNQVGFSMKDGVGKTEATFTGGSWGLKPSATYAAFYPLIPDFNIIPTDIPIHYNGQTQISNGSSAHVGEFDYMVAPLSEVKSGAVNFNFDHIGCLIHFKLTIPANGIYKALLLKTEEAVLVEKASVNLQTKGSDGVASVAPTKKAKQLVLAFDDLNMTAGTVLDAYMKVAPQDLKGITIKLQLVDEGYNVYSTSFEGVTFGNNEIWNLEKTQFEDKSEITGTWSRLNEGSSFNVLMKNLANNTLGSSTNSIDSKIKSIRFKTNSWENKGLLFVEDDFYNTYSYMNWNADKGEITITMNGKYHQSAIDNKCMFAGLSKLEYIDFADFEINGNYYNSMFRFSSTDVKKCTLRTTAKNAAYIAGEAIDGLGYDKVNWNIIDKDNESDFCAFAGAYLKGIEESIYYNKNNGVWEYQLIQNLNADLYSGYCAISTTFNNGINNNNYFMMDGWNSYALDYYMKDVIIPALSILEVENLPEECRAIAIILKVAGAHKLVDTYGPCPYSKVTPSNSLVEYDSEDQIYNSFLTELSEASELLTNWLDKNKGKDLPNHLKFDVICGQSQQTWLKFANTLRLRLAMRCAMVDATLAKKHAEAACANKYGLLKDRDIELLGYSIQNPLYVIAFQYGDCALSANFETILLGYHDSRLSKLVMPVGYGSNYYVDIKTPSGVDAGYLGKIKGIRNGIIPGKQEYASYSKPCAISNYSPTSYDGYSTPYANLFPLPIMSRSESSFLQAEGALRGWNIGGGTVQFYYEEGIKNSYAKFGLDATSYLQGTTTQIDYIDPHNPANNCKAVNKVPVKYMNTGSKEEQLQQIITQKWIAGFPEGLNAWAEYRRTGYPKLFPIPSKNCQTQSKYLQGSMEKLIEIGPRRLPFSIDEQSKNPSGYASGLSILNASGRKDVIDARLWWDTGRNF